MINIHGLLCRSFHYSSRTETNGNSGIWRPLVAAGAPAGRQGRAAVIVTWIRDVEIQAPGPESGQDFCPPGWKTRSKWPF